MMSKISFLLFSIMTRLLLIAILVTFPMFSFASEDCDSGESSCTVTCDNSDDQTDFTQAITDVDAGTTISVAGSNCDINSTITVNKAVKIQGDGATAWTGTSGSAGSSAAWTGTTTVDVGADPAFDISLSSDVAVEISGLFFDATTTNTNTPIKISGKVDGSFGYTQIKIFNNKFEQGGEAAGQIYPRGWVECVIYNNVFDDFTRAAIHISGGDVDYPWDTWTTTVESGKKTLTASTSHAVFIEDNYFLLDAGCTEVPHSAIYSQESPRWVARYNTFETDGCSRTSAQYYELDVHGNQSLYDDPGSLVRGGAIVEVYNNYSEVDTDAQWLGVRAGSLLAHNNTVVADGTPEIELAEQETTGAYGMTEDDTYPCEDQVHNTFIWSNTGLTTTIDGGSETVLAEDKSFFLAAPQSSGGYEYYDDRMGAAGNASDGTLTFSAGGANAYHPYTAFTYPHPLRSTTLQGITPTGVSINQ